MDNNFEKIKLIAMDFDGTLLTSDKRITNKTKDCLISLKNKDYKIIGVTARNLLSVKETIDIALFDFVILNNGSNVYSVKDDKIDNIQCINFTEAKKIFDLFKNRVPRIDFCTPYKYLSRTQIKEDTRTFVTYIDEFDEVNKPISRMNIFFNNDEEIENIIKTIKSNFDSVEVCKMIDTDNPNSKKWITLNPKNISKLNTLNDLCQRIGCNLNEVIFFGDGENDLSLIEHAGIAVAMANAVDIIKTKATALTLSNDEDGVANYLEKYIIKN